MVNTDLCKNQIQEIPENLIGKSIIVCTSPKGDQLYYRDRSQCKKGFWSVYISKAYAFPSQITAKAYCKRLRYNNPTVKYVDPHTYQLRDV